MTIFDKRVVDDNNIPQLYNDPLNTTVGPQKPVFFTHLDTNGDGTGSDDMNVDGSITPVRFSITPPPGNVYRIAKFMMYIQDTGTFDTGFWGNNITMVNGIQFITTRGGVDREVLKHPIRTSGDLAELTFNVRHENFGSGDEFLVSEWKIAELGQFFRLDGDNNDSFSVTINDDLTNLNHQQVMAQGYIEEYTP